MPSQFLCSPPPFPPLTPLVRAVPGLAITEITYGSLMQACIRADELDAAFKVLTLAEDTKMKLGA